MLIKKKVPPELVCTAKIEANCDQAFGDGEATLGMTVEALRE
jgi:hypothetical protein